MAKDIDPGDVLYFNFTTLDLTASPAVPFALSGGAVSVYKDDNTTQSTAGVTLTASFDSVTGLNNVKIDTSADGTFYAAGHHFQAILTAGTVNGVTVVGYVLKEFTIQVASVLRPTTDKRKLDVSSGGEAGVDWANVGSPTTSNALTGTTISASQVVASVTAGVTLAAGAIQAIWDALTSALTTSGSIGKLLVDNINVTLSSLATAANLSTLTTTANTINTNVSTALTNLTTILNRIGAFTGSGLNTILGFLRAMARKDAALTPSDMAGTFDNTTDSLQAIEDNGPAASGSVTVSGYVAGQDPATYVLATPANKLETDGSGQVTVGTIASAALLSIWTVLTSSLTTAGSIGKLLVDNINATILSRLADADYTAPDNATIGTISTDVTSVLARIGAFTGTGINTILGFLRAMMRSDVGLTPSDVGGAYDNTAESLQAIGEGAAAAGAKDWTDDERMQIRKALGVTGTVADTSGDGIIDAILTAVSRITETRAGNLDTLPAINTGVAALVAANTDYTDVTSVADAKMTPAKGIRFLVGRFLNKATQSATEQELFNDAGDLIATLPVSNEGGVQKYDQAA